MENKKLENYLLNYNLENKGSIDSLVHENRTVMYNDLKGKMNQSLKEIVDIETRIEKEGIKKNSKKVEMVLNDVLNVFEYSDELLEDIPIGLQSLHKQLSSKYRKLEYKLFKYNIDSMKNSNISLRKDMENQTSILTGEIEKSEQLKSEQEKLSEEVFEKIEGIGSTTLNMILTISIVTAAIAIVTDIKDTKYIPMFILSIVWILFTSIIFNASMFKSRNIQRQKLDYNEILCIITYSLLSLGTLACILVTCLK